MNKIELQSAEEGYAHVSVNDSSPVTLAALKQAIAKTPFKLNDVQWPVRPPESSSELSVEQRRISK